MVGTDVAMLMSPLAYVKLVMSIHVPVGDHPRWQLGLVHVVLRVGRRPAVVVVFRQVPVA